jgi:glycosyltransferase involved in cell wall biosynthesis
MVTRPLTVLQLTHQGFGAGSTQSIFDLSVHLARLGHRVLVGCGPETLLARRVRSAAALEHVPLDYSHIGSVARAVQDLARREGVDVVNSHATRDRRACAWLRWRGRLPQALVVTRRTMPRTLPPALLAMALTADRTIAVSAAVASALRHRLHPSSRVRVVPNGIDLARIDAPVEVAEARAALPPDGGRPLVVIPARRKDQEVVLRALAILEYPVTLACVGIEPDDALKRELREVPSRHKAVFVPFTEHAALAFYRLATVVALPSRIEGLSQALLEAMALGLPIVASDSGGNRDLVITDRTGLLVRPLDPAAWADAIATLLSSPDYARRLGAAARERVRSEYTLERTAERTERVYREAVERRRLLGPERLR